MPCPACRSSLNRPRFIAVQNLKQAGKLQRISLSRALRKRKIRQKNGIQNFPLNSGELLPGRNCLQTGFQQRRKKQRLPRQLHRPPGAVGILRQFHHHTVMNQILSGHPAFQAKLSRFSLFQLQIGQNKLDIRLRIRAAIPLQLRKLGKRKFKIPGMHIAFIALIDQMHNRRSPEQELIGHHLFLCHLCSDGIIKDSLHRWNMTRQCQFLIQRKCLFSRFTGKHHGIGSFQQLNIRRKLIRRTDGFLSRVQRFRHGGNPGPHHDLPR